MNDLRRKGIKGFDVIWIIDKPMKHDGQKGWSFEEFLGFLKHALMIETRNSNFVRNCCSYCNCLYLSVTVRKIKLLSVTVRICP